MTRSNPNPVAQPSLQDLMVRFLASRSDAADGSAVEPAGGEVEPHEVAAGFRVDPRAAWTNATDALPARPESSKLPTEWPALVGQPSAAFAVAFAAGNFPQRVKDLQPLLAKFDPAGMRPSGSQPPSQGLSGLRTWVIRETKKGQPVPALLAAGVARVIGEFDWAEELLGAAESLCGGELRAAWENERAALLWHRGRTDEALAAWNALPESPAVLFNRGMALLFLGRLTEARAVLTRAIAVLPDESGWNALARLYLAIAEIHG
jgi:tetratricopeptide (TPR) repeat protein